MRTHPATVIYPLFYLSGPYSGDVTDARDKNVIVIGGGDTGVDCVATCVRQVCVPTTGYCPGAPCTKAG